MNKTYQMYRFARTKMTSLILKHTKKTASLEVSAVFVFGQTAPMPGNVPVRSLLTYRFFNSRSLAASDLALYLFKGLDVPVPDRNDVLIVV